MTTIKCTVQRSSWYSVYIEYSSKQDTINNQSTITHALKLKQLTDDYDFNGYMDIAYYVEGEKFSYSGNIDINNKGNAGYTITIKSGTTIVDHHANGAKNVAFSVSGSCNSGGYGPGTISLATVNIPMPTIARASTIDAADAVTLGNACGIKWTPKASTFHYKVKFSIGGWSYTTDAISPNSIYQYTYTGYVIPLTVANQITNAVKGSMTATLYTYNDKACTAQIGSAATKQFDAIVPDNIMPTVKDVAITIDNSGNSIVNGWGVAVAGYTAVRVVGSAYGSYGSTIKSYYISEYNHTFVGDPLDYTGGVIASSGKLYFDVTAIDSRGRSSQQYLSNSVMFYEYRKPEVTALVVDRAANDPSKIVVTADWSYSDVNGNNATVGKLYYKKPGDKVWNEYGAVAKGELVTLTTEFAQDKSYNFYLIVTDTLGNKAEAQGFVSTIAVLLDYRAGGKGLGIGKIAEHDRLEVALDAVFYGNIKISDGETEISLEDYIKGLIASG